MTAPATRDQTATRSSKSRQNAVLTGIGLAALVLLEFVRALEDQIARLLPPPLDPFGPAVPSYQYVSLHGADASKALKVWNDGARTLDGFGSIDPSTIVTVHVVFDTLFALLLATFLVLLVRRVALPKWLFWIIGIGALADVTENVLELGRVHEWLPVNGGFNFLFTALGWIKLLPLVVAAIVVAAIIQRGGIGQAWQYYRKCSATSRLIVAAALGFGLLLQLGDIGAQAEDLLRRELSLGGLARAGCFLALYLGVIAIVRRIGIGPGTEPDPDHIMWLGAGLFAVGWIPIVVTGRTTALVVLGVMVVIIGAASKLVPAHANAREVADPGAGLYTAAGILPPLGLAFVTARLLAGEVATAGRWKLLTFTVVALVGIAVAVGWWFEQSAAMITGNARGKLRGRMRGFPWPLTAALVAVVAAVVALAVVQAGSPGSTDGIGDTLGPFGVLLLALAGFAAAAGLSRLVSKDLGRPAIFTWFKMPRTPVITLLLVWFVVVNVGTIRFERSDASSHLVRQIDREAQPARAKCPDDLPLGGTEVAVALCQWLEVNAKIPDGVAPPDGPVPLVLVSASGGGVRAAAWTARVLDCLLLAPPAHGHDPCGSERIAQPRADSWSRLFAAGGASGGSVGIVSALAHQITQPTNEADWIRPLAGNDHVSRILSRMALSELPLAPFGVAAGHDTAEVLTDSWTARLNPISECPDLRGRRVADVGFFSLRDHCPEQVPLLMLNGTVVKTGKRFDISPLELSDTPGLVDVVCASKDVPLFDAAFLSARFPFVTPSGHFMDADHEDSSCSRDTKSAVEVVDGGYAENSGAAQISTLWSRLRPLVDGYNDCPHPGYRDVRVVFVEIENGEHAQPIGAMELDGAFGGAVGEPLKPISAALKARLGGIEAAAMDDLRERFRAAHVPVLKAKLYPHPGRRLPLGWTLTNHILGDVDQVFRLKPNVCVVNKFRAYLHGKVPEVAKACPASVRH